nr:hypothetical protein CR513_13785 [Ipomoea batatas]
MSPGSLALEGFTWPPPVAQTSAGTNLSSRILVPFRLYWSAVVMIADFIAAGDQSGCALLSNAAIPLRNWPGRKNVDPGAENIRLEDSRASTARSPGGERCNRWGSFGANDCSFEHNCGCGGRARMVYPSISRFTRIMAAPPASFTVFPLSTLAIPPPLSHNTTFPFTSVLANEPGPHRAASSSFAPGYIKGNKVGGKLWTWKADSPDNCSPFPSTAVAFMVLSIVLAPTVRIHGASLDKVE